MPARIFNDERDSQNSVRQQWNQGFIVWSGCSTRCGSSVYHEDSSCLPATEGLINGESWLTSCLHKTTNVFQNFLLTLQNHSLLSDHISTRFSVLRHEPLRRLSQPRNCLGRFDWEVNTVAPLIIPEDSARKWARCWHTPSGPTRQSDIIKFIRNFKHGLNVIDNRLLRGEGEHL